MRPARQTGSRNSIGPFLEGKNMSHESIHRRRQQREAEERAALEAMGEKVEQSAPLQKVISSPFSEDTRSPGTQIDARILAHIVHIDQILSAFYRLVLWSLVVGLIGAVFAILRALGVF
jgi:hypothetical protein